MWRGAEELSRRGKRGNSADNHDRIRTIYIYIGCRRQSCYAASHKHKHCNICKRLQVGACSTPWAAAAHPSRPSIALFLRVGLFFFFGNSKEEGGRGGGYHCRAYCCGVENVRGMNNGRLRSYMHVLKYTVRGIGIVTN